MSFRAIAASACSTSAWADHGAQPRARPASAAVLPSRRAGGPGARRLGLVADEADEREREQRHHRHEERAAPAPVEHERARSARAATTSRAPQKSPASVTAGSSQSQSTAACAADGDVRAERPGDERRPLIRVAASTGIAEHASSSASPTTPSSASVSR